MSVIFSAAMERIRNSGGLWDTAWKPLDWKVSRAPFSAEVFGLTTCQGVY